MFGAMAGFLVLFLDSRNFPPSGREGLTNALRFGILIFGTKTGDGYGTKIGIRKSIGKSKSPWWQAPRRRAAQRQR